MTPYWWPLALPLLALAAILLGMALLVATPFLWVAWLCGGCK